MKPIACLPTALLLATLALPVRLAADGALDTSFQAPNGYRTLGSATVAGARGTAAPDGAAIFVGAQGGTAILWGRVLPSGAPGTCVFVPPGVASVAPAEAAFDGAGRLLVAGTASYSALGQVIFVARYLYPDCALDATFDGDGYFTFDLADDVVAVGLATTVVTLFGSPVERIVVGGNRYAASGPDFSDLLLLRLTGSGALDPAFGGGDGWASYDFDAETNVLADLAIDSVKRIVLGGTVDPFGGDVDAMVARTLSNGALDESFGDFGWTRISPVAEAFDETLGALALAADDSVWVATSEATQTPDAWRLLVRELDPAGASIFAVGWYYHDAPLRAVGIVRQGDRRVIVLGDTGHVDGDRDLFVTACRPTMSSHCAWETAFGPLGDDYLSFPVPDLVAGGDESARGLVLAAGRPLLFAESDAATGQRGLVARLENAYIFADDFEAGSTAAW